MNTGYFISKRISHLRQGGFTRTVYRIAVISVAVGLAAAIISFLVMRGFQATIKDKIYGFNAHLLITKFATGNDIEGEGFFFDIDRYQAKNDKRKGCIDHMQAYGYKLGLIQAENDVLGVAFKGVGKRFDISRFETNMVEGTFFHRFDSGYAKEVVISRRIADKLGIGVGDDFVMCFFQNPPRFRKLSVSGLYATNLSDYFDDKLIIGDIRLVKRLNNWADGVVGGIEIYVKDNECIDEAYDVVSRDVDYDLYLETTRDKYAEVFEWLDLLDRQVSILLGIIFIVVCVNMIAIVIILAMERTQMVGLLKALGASDRLIGSLFLYSGIRLIAKGLVYGNVLGLGICFIQYAFQVVKLNPDDYYMAFVPIAWDWHAVLVLNGLTFVLIGLALMVPAAVATRTDPIEAIRFD